MHYYFLYSPAYPYYPYAIFSDDMQHNVIWEKWGSNKYTKKEITSYNFLDYIGANPRFIVVAMYDYPILPSEITQLHPELFI